MKELQLDILAVDGPLLRTYLSVMHSHGYRPRRIFRLINDAGEGATPVLRHFPAFLRMPLLKYRQNFSETSWVRGLTLRYSASWKKYLEAAGHATQLSDTVIAGIADVLQRVSPSPLFLCPVIDIPARGLGDPRLRERLIAYKADTLLSTSDAIAPASLLHIPGLKTLLMHPGVLPYKDRFSEPFLRGSDMLFWSALIREKAAVSGIYMEPGIDEGEVFYCKEFPLPQLPDIAEKVPGDSYYLIRAFVSPVYRAKGLLDVIENVTRDGGDFHAIPSMPQDTGKGISLYIMHPWLREKAVAKMTPARSSGEV